MVILATKQREIGSNPLRKANCTFDVNGEMKFSVKIARCYWTEEMTYGNLVYIPDTEFGGIVGEILTSTTLDYVELKGYTWRGRLAYKAIEPPSGSDYKVVSGELNTVLKSLIEPEFGGLYVVSGENTGVSVSNYQFDRYCMLLEGITKMLKSVGYRLDIRHKREQGVPGYILIRAVPIIDYSDQIELSKDCGLNYTMEDIRDGVNHLIVTGKGELQDRNVFHLYAWPDGSIKKTQYYKGLDEITQVYENTSTETDQLEDQSIDKLTELMSKKKFGMDVEKLGIDVEFTEINWDSKEVELSSKNIDCIWNGMCITEERKQNMSISDPYLYNTQAMVMKKSREKEIMKSVKGLTVTAEQGSTGEGKIDGSIADDDTVKVSAQDYFKDANYVASDSMAKALMEVKSGTADVALVDSVCALGMVGEGTDYSDLVINMDNNFGQQEYGIAFRKGSDVTEKVNEAIKELYEDGTVDTIAKKYGLQEMLIK